MSSPPLTSTSSPIAIPQSQHHHHHQNHRCTAAEWVADQGVSFCVLCKVRFGVVTRKHHCRSCGGIFCGACSKYSLQLPEFNTNQAQRVCATCHSALKAEEAALSPTSPPSSSSSPSASSPSSVSLTDLPDRKSPPPPTSRVLSNGNGNGNGGTGKSYTVASRATTHHHFGPQCVVCFSQVRFHHTSEVIAHMTSKHPAQTRALHFHCSVCNYRYLLSQGYEAHSRSYYHQSRLRSIGCSQDGQPAEYNISHMLSPSVSPGHSPSSTMIASPSMSMNALSSSSAAMSYPATPADFDGPVQVFLRLPGACAAMDIEQYLTVRQVKDRVAMELNNNAPVEVVQRYGRGRLVEDDKTLLEYQLAKPDAIPLVFTPLAADGRSLLTGAAYAASSSRSTTISSSSVRASTITHGSGRLSGLPTERSPAAFLRWSLATATLNGRAIATCANVCRQWRDLCSSEVVWRTVTLAKFAHAFALVSHTGRVGPGASHEAPLWPIAGGEWPTWRTAYREYSMSHKFCPKPQNRTPIGEPRMFDALLRMWVMGPESQSLVAWFCDHRSWNDARTPYHGTSCKTVKLSSTQQVKVSFGSEAETDAPFERLSGAIIIFDVTRLDWDELKTNLATLVRNHHTEGLPPVLIIGNTGHISREQPRRHEAADLKAWSTVSSCAYCEVNLRTGLGVYSAVTDLCIAASTWYHRHAIDMLAKQPSMRDLNAAAAPLPPLSPIAPPSAAAKEKVFRMVVLGNGFVGKTALVTRWCDGTFAARAISGSEKELREKRVRYGKQAITLSMVECPLHIWRDPTQRLQRLQGIHGAIVVFDLSDKSSLDDVYQFLRALQNERTSRPVVVVGNKSDLESERAVSVEELKEYWMWANNPKYSYIEVSCKSGRNVTGPFSRLARMIDASLDESLQEDGEMGDPNDRMTPAKDDKQCTIQ